MRKILVIEDNEMNREILQDILCEEYEVLEAENGAEGLKLLEQYYQELSVILLDLQMPVMNGFEFLEKIRTDALLSTVPVIVMTADENGDTESRCMELGAVEFLEKPYNPVIMFGRIRNMIRMREAAADIQSIEYDEVTGLYTRQAFYHYAEKRLKENPDKSYSVLISDIREFKLINSAYGEEGGNRVLKAIADQLRRDGQKYDCISGHYGADRFVIMVEADIIPSEKILEEMLMEEKEIPPAEHIRMKLGIYENVDPALSIAVICDRAISALDTIRNSYDRNTANYDGPLAQKQRQNQQMEADFPRALEAGEFVPWFQPKADPSSDTIVGAEALVRWKKQDGSYTPPYLFIPLFEKDDLVAQLDECMFRQVCKLQSLWKSQGKRIVPISVNMSRTTLLRSGSVERYLKMAEEAGTPLDMVPVEITESSAFLSSQISERMNQLKEAGFTLHMDDFGSGYSSLTSLSVLPFDVIKLDKSLADHVETPKGGMIVRHMLQVVRELGMQSVVEGAETAEQVAVLRDLGCDAIQGYYYSRPVPREDFEEMLDNGLKK